MEKQNDIPLREFQLILLGILKDVADVCRKNDIRFYLGEGSMLGAVRHSGFIPWDDERLCQGYISHLLKNNGPFVDIFPMDYVPKPSGAGISFNSFRIKLYKAMLTYKFKVCAPSSCYDEVLEIDFEDTKMPVPKGYDEVLTIIYGDYMTPPKEAQRVQKHSIGSNCSTKSEIKTPVRE